eukprot:4221493-Ditylum_brightwellii.AAC.1
MANNHTIREDNGNGGEQSALSSWRIGRLLLYNVDTDGDGDDEVEEILFGGGTTKRSEKS